MVLYNLFGLAIVCFLGAFVWSMLTDKDVQEMIGDDAMGTMCVFMIPMLWILVRVLI